MRTYWGRLVKKYGRREAQEIPQAAMMLLAEMKLLEETGPGKRAAPVALTIKEGKPVAELSSSKSNRRSHREARLQV